MAQTLKTLINIRNGKKSKKKENIKKNINNKKQTNKKE
jgi:hypothetical protein